MHLKPITSLLNKYYASYSGHIYSGERFKKNGQYIPPKKINEKIEGSRKDRVDRGSYLSVHITVSGVERFCSVHRLVAEAWIPEFTKYHEVHHIDGNPFNNRVDNLQVVTRAEHEKLHGIDVPRYDLVNAQYDIEQKLKRDKYGVDLSRYSADKKANVRQGKARFEYRKYRQMKRRMNYGANRLNKNKFKSKEARNLQIENINKALSDVEDARKGIQEFLNFERGNNAKQNKEK